jgi:hypothetical protein
MEFALAAAIGIAGMLFHFYKRKAKNQTLDGLKTYIVGHPVYTVMALAATVGGSLVLAPTLDFANLPGMLPVATAIFGVGYMCDSAINKAVSDS